MHESFTGPEEILDRLMRRYPDLETLRNSIEHAFALLSSCFDQGGKLLLCGNGGSAADALHITGELMKAFTLPRPVDLKTHRSLMERFPGEAELLNEKLQQALPAIALVESAALSTAVQNDTEAKLVFAQQVYGLGRKGDALMCISTSGDSMNCVYAAEVAKSMEMTVVSLTGKGGGKLSQISDAAIAVPETECYKVQELHLPVYHAICLMLEYRFFKQ